MNVGNNRKSLPIMFIQFLTAQTTISLLNIRYEYVNVNFLFYYRWTKHIFIKNVPSHIFIPAGIFFVLMHFHSNAR